MLSERRSLIFADLKAAPAACRQLRISTDEKRVVFFLYDSLAAWTPAGVRVCARACVHTLMQFSEAASATTPSMEAYLRAKENADWDISLRSAREGGRIQPSTGRRGSSQSTNTGENRRSESAGGERLGREPLLGLTFVSCVSGWPWPRPLSSLNPNSSAAGGRDLCRPHSPPAIAVKLKQDNVCDHPKTLQTYKALVLKTITRIRSERLKAV